MTSVKKVWETGAWESTAEAEACVGEICEGVGLTQAMARLLYRRGYRNADEVMRFLGMKEAVLHDPFLMKDMDKAVARILRAVENNEHVAIYGDYDADGVSSTAMLFLYLEEIAPKMTLGYYIPDRHAEGYGMSVMAIDKLAEKGVQLIVTVDNGISAASEIAYAASLGIDVVVTDHHECPAVLPNAGAVVDPHQPLCEYPFKDLAGVGVAFKLITAIERKRRGETVSARQVDEEIYFQYADLAALGTVADVMPVTGENRLIISYGLKRMFKAPRPGIRALLEQSGALKNGKITASSIGFGLAPRINAAGRMNKPSKAVELLLLSEEDENASFAANLIAEALCEYNKERQAEEARIVEEACRKIEESFSPEDRVIVVDGEEWHSGVIGIVASRVTERYHRPSILITYKDATDRTGGAFDMGKGSGRSVDGVNLIEAIAHASDCLAKFGGHESAAGLSVTRGNVDTLRSRLNSYMKERYENAVFEPKVYADLALSASDLTMNFAGQLLLLEPFGNANPTPLFYLDDVTITKSYAIGTGKHLKLMLEKDGVGFGAVMFNAPYEAFNRNVGDRVDLLFQLEINEYNHTKSLQLLVREMRSAEVLENAIAARRLRYDALQSGSDLCEEECLLPEREHFAALYRILRNLAGSGRFVIAERSLYQMASGSMNRELDYVTFLLTLDVLHEMNLCDISRKTSDLLECRICPTGQKVDLEQSAILRDLRLRQKKRGSS